MSETNYMKLVKRAFPNATWENPGVLPSWTARHGSLKLEKSIKHRKYSKKYSFAGCAKRFNIEAVGRQGEIISVWNEQLVPWPWFALVVAIPGDRSPLEDRDPDEKRCYVVFCDESGVYSFQSESNEVKEGFKKIQESHTMPEAPNFIPESWDNVSEEVWEEIILKKGTITTI